MERVEDSVIDNQVETEYGQTKYFEQGEPLEYVQLGLHEPEYFAYPPEDQ